MIVQYKKDHFINFSNIAEIQFHEQSFSVHLKTVGSNLFSYTQFDCDDFYNLREQWIAFVGITNPDCPHISKI